MLTVYSKNGCPHCVSAITLLEEENIAHTVIKIDEDVAGAEFIRQELHRSVPQIYKGKALFVNGGYQGLLKLWRSGELKNSID
jgi:glutaredoxin